MKHLLYIGNKLSKHGNTLTSIETLGAFLESENYTVYYASSKKNQLLRLFDMVWKTLIYSKKVDFVLIDTYSTLNFWYAFVVSQLCRLLHVRYITKLHGGDLPNRINKNPALSNMIFSNSYINVAPSQYLFEAFQRKGYSKLIYIPNTIEIQKYPFKKREFLQPKLFWVRSFAKIYNPTMAVKVFAEIKKDFPNATLCMVGPIKDDSYEETVLLAEKLNVTVTFTGMLSKEAWIAESSNYDIFINTTHFDNMPVSVVEAMALGLPVVSTDVGGIPFLLEHKINALLVGDDAVDSMVDAIKSLLTSPKLVLQITENARITVSNFDWKIVKNQWFELLQ
jgi:glycosyltransferase involved in cell wall biosynthesis